MARVKIIHVIPKGNQECQEPEYLFNLLNKHLLQDVVINGVSVRTNICVVDATFPTSDKKVKRTYIFFPQRVYERKDFEDFFIRRKKAAGYRLRKNPVSETKTF